MVTHIPVGVTLFSQRMSLNNAVEIATPLRSGCYSISQRVSLKIAVRITRQIDNHYVAICLIAAMKPTLSSPDDVVQMYLVNACFIAATRQIGTQWLSGE